MSTSQPGKGELGKAGRLHRGLNILIGIDDVRDILRVRLRLIPSAHDAERDAHVALFHERRNDGMQRALVRRESVRANWDRARRARRDSAARIRCPPPRARTKRRVVALDQRHHVAVAIDNAEIGRVVRRAAACRRRHCNWLSSGSISLARCGGEIFREQLRPPAASKISDRRRSEPGRRRRVFSLRSWCAATRSS